MIGSFIVKRMTVVILSNVYFIFNDTPTPEIYSYGYTLSLHDALPIFKAWAQSALDGSPIEAGPLDLRLAFNPGAAFSIAADAPSWVMLSIKIGRAHV